MRASLPVKGLFVVLAILCAPPAPAAQARAAVAANFLSAARELADGFSASSGHRVDISSGSTGQLYAQIIRGAPYDLLLAADQDRPARLESQGRAVAGSRFTYARGRLVLWSVDALLIGDDPDNLLRHGEFRRLALANPRLAPYGLAAWQVLGRLGVRERLANRLVRGENVAQAYAMAASGNAELAFVAAALPRPGDGSRWLVPESLHEPIRQDAVLLQRGADNPAAREFLEYLRSAPALDRIRARGYGVE